MPEIPQSEIAATHFFGGREIGLKIGRNFERNFRAFSCFACCAELRRQFLPKFPRNLSLPVLRMKGQIWSPWASGVGGCQNLGTKKRTRLTFSQNLAWTFLRISHKIKVLVGGRNNQKGGSRPQAYVRARASSATLCSVHPRYDYSEVARLKSSILGGKKAGPQKTGLGSPKFPRIVRNLWGSAGRFCRTFHMVESLLKKGSAEPQRFCRTLRAKPSFSGPANSCPKSRFKYQYLGRNRKRQWQRASCGPCKPIPPKFTLLFGSPFFRCKEFPCFFERFPFFPRDFIVKNACIFGWSSFSPKRGRKGRSGQGVQIHRRTVHFFGGGSCHETPQNKGFRASELPSSIFGPLGIGSFHTSLLSSRGPGDRISLHDPANGAATGMAI